MMLADDGPDGTVLSYADSGGTASFQDWADAPLASPTGAFAAMAELRQLADPEAEPGDDAPAWHLPPPGLHVTGSQLRRRLVTPESIAALAAPEKRGLLHRLRRR